MKFGLFDLTYHSYFHTLNGEGIFPMDQEPQGVGPESPKDKKKEHPLIAAIREFLKALLRKRSVEEVTNKEVQEELKRRTVSEGEKNSQPKTLIEKVVHAMSGEKSATDTPDPQLQDKVRSALKEGFVDSDKGKIFASEDTIIRVLTIKLNRIPTKDEIAEATNEGMSLTDAKYFAQHQAIQEKVSQEQATLTPERLTKIIEAARTSPSETFVSGGRMYGSIEGMRRAYKDSHNGREPIPSELSKITREGISLEELKSNIINTSVRERYLAALKEAEEKKGEPLTEEERYKIFEGIVPIIKGGAPEGEEAAQRNEPEFPPVPVDREAIRQQLKDKNGGVEPSDQEVDAAVEVENSRNRHAQARGIASYTEASPAIQGLIDEDLRARVNPETIRQQRREAAQEQAGGRESERESLNDLDDLIDLIAYENPTYEYRTASVVDRGTRRVRELTPGDFPLRDPETREINQGNLLRWLRDRMIFHHNNNSDDQISFGQLITLERGLKHMGFGTIMNNIPKYFRTKEGLFYEELANQITREMWLFNASRNNDIDYKNVMGGDEELPKKIYEMFYRSTFTKTAWERSTMYWIFSLPQDYKSTIRNVFTRQDETTIDDNNVDARVGSAARTAYLTYYHMADFPKLQELLGKDAALFQRGKFIEHMKRLNAKRNLRTVSGFGGNEEWRNGLTTDDAKSLEEMFEDNGAIKQAGFIDFVNIFNEAQKANKTIEVVRSLIRDSVAKRHEMYVRDLKTGQIKKDKDTGEDKVDEASVGYGEAFAYTMPRWTGVGARNDTSAAAFDAWTKTQNTRPYREKQFNARRGGAYGNPYSVRAIKKLGPDMMTGIRTESKHTSGQYEGQYKTPLTVLEELERLELENPNITNEEMKKHLAELNFPDNTMRAFATNHVRNSFNIFHTILGAKELKIDKFAHFDAYGRLVFDEAEFSEAIKESFIKPMRYAYSTYDMFDFSQPVRTLVEVKEGSPPKWVDMPLAEAMFGKEILDIPKFWKDGKPHEIDYQKVQNDKASLWKQFGLERIAAELYAHRDLKSPYPRYNMETIETVIAALERIPGEITGDETGANMQNIRVGKRFFEKEDIDWLRKKSKTEFWRLWAHEAGPAVVGGSIDAIRKSFKELLAYMTK